MFYRYRWIELLYCLSGNVVVIVWCTVLLLQVYQWSDAQRSRIVEALGPLIWVLLGLGLVIAFVFPFALLCTAALLASITGRYAAAEGLYQFSLKLRSNIPFVGKTARADFWTISLANCRRELGQYDEAEELYVAVIERQEKLTAIEKVTHYGLSEAARENYAALLEATGRTAQAQAVSEGISPVLVQLRAKYLLAVAFVLVGGLLCAVWLHYEINMLAGR